ncbi:MAG: sulfotransferase [Planctomycetota bacterium]
MMPAEPNQQPAPAAAPGANPQQPTPQQVFESAKRLLAMGDVHEALQHAALLRGHFPDQTPILAIHGIAMAALGAHGIAIPDLASAAEDTKHALDTGDPENPNRPRIADQLLRVLTELARSHEAMDEPALADERLTQADEVDPEAPEVIRTRVEILCGRGDPESASSVLEEADRLGLEELPSALCAGAIALASGDAPSEASGLLAQRLRALADRVGLDAATQALVLRRSANLFDRAGDYDEAFRTFTRAANFTRGQYDAAVHAQMTNAIIGAWTEQAMSKVSRPDRDHGSRIFVVGAPHSGATELAAALAALPGVANAGPAESLTVAAAQKAGAQRTPYRPAVPSPEKLRRDQLEATAGVYTRLTDGAAYPKEHTATIDACGLHVHLLGLAALALPKARFVFVRREARENLLSAFFNGVPGHHPYAKDFPALAAYLRDYDRTLDHWASIFSNMGVDLIETTREALASDGTGESERIASACSLERDTPAAVSFRSEPADHPDQYARRLEPVLPYLPEPRV